MQEQSKPKRHIVNIYNREKIEVSEVICIEYFTPEAVAAKTQSGRLVVKGQNLFVDTMDSKEGNMLIKGKINGIIYENTGEEKSLIKKLFK